MQDLYGGYNPYPYIYIQYSHDDIDKVIPIIKALKARNYNIVYDKNFNEEDKYRYLNVQQMTQAAAFMFFYSKSAAKSRLIKESIRFAVPMYNLEKICICLDDTRFGFSFSDLKKNYTVICESETDKIMAALHPYIETFILPNSASSAERYTPDEPVELTETEWLDELEEIGLLPETNEEVNNANIIKETDDYGSVEQIAEILDYEKTERHKTEADSAQKRVRQNQPPEHYYIELPPDSPEAFPDFDMPYDFPDDEDIFSMIALSDGPDQVPEEYAPKKISQKPARQPVSKRQAPQQPSTTPAPEELSQKKPVAETDSQAIWNDIRKKMHLRAMNKTRLFIKPVTSQKSYDPHELNQQNSGIHAITIDYPTDEDVPDYTHSPEPIMIAKKPESSKAKPDIDISEISHKPEPAESRPTVIESRSTSEFTPQFTENPPPSEVLPVPLNEPQTEVNGTFTFGMVRTPEQEYSAKPVYSYHPMKNDYDDEPDDEEEFVTIQPVQIHETVEKKSVQVYETAEEEPVPVQGTVEKKTVPVQETVEKKPVPVQETVEEEPVRVQETVEEEPVPVQETVEEEPVPVQETVEEEPVPVQETVEEEPELNSYEYFSQNVLSEMDSDSTWNGESFFAQIEPEPEPEPDPEIETQPMPEPVDYNDYLIENASQPVFSDEKTDNSSSDSSDEEEEFRQYEEFIHSNEHKDDKEPEQVDIKTQILIKAAEQGNADAQYKLGASYEHGDRVELNYVKAAHWYILSSNRGNANAQFNLANMYEQGLGVVKNLYEAADLYKAAAEQGHSNAQTHYGLCLKNGVGTDRNASEAVKWFVKASEKGNAAAIYHLGVCFECGEGVEKDFSHALQLYLASANQNYAEAQNALANCYMSGTGVPSNYTEAVRWYSKAARGGNAAAQFNIGFCCENGLGIDKNPDMAYRFYRIAADNGSESALNRLKELGFVKTDTI